MKMSIEKLQETIDELAYDFEWEVCAGDPRGLAAGMDSELCELEEKMKEMLQEQS